MICPQCKHLNPPSSHECLNCNWKLKCEPIEDTKQVNHRPGQPTTHSTTSSINSETQLGIDDLDDINLLNELDSFEIHQIIGKGGMGNVYHASDKVLHRDVAIKVLRSNVQENLTADTLLAEARIASQLNHPNIVTIYDVARSKNKNYIVMERVKGKSLDELMPINGFSLLNSLNYALQIAKGLSFAHEQLIIHRDIKPQNIMLNSEGQIKILDFGVSGLINPNEPDLKPRSTKHVIGTPKYMSPEQIKKLNLDHRSDVFSFGAVFYEMLCGQSPFPQNSIDTLYDAILTGNYVPIHKKKPDLPLRVVTVVEKMLAKNRQDRWQSTKELAVELIDIYKELTYQQNWWKRSHWMTKAVITVTFLFALGWNLKDIAFPLSTQQLIDRQLEEATKIAIMPFENISGDPQIQLFSDGLSVNLGSDLSSIASAYGDLWVIPSTEIRRFDSPTPQIISDKFGVNLILTGSIQHMGSTRLVVLNLINSQNGQQLKTVEMSINAAELFQGYEMIREKTLSLLNWSVPDTLTAQFNAQRPQLDGAYKAYISGQGHLYRYDQTGNLEKSLNAFTQAIELDPNYESAYVGLIETFLLHFDKSKNIQWLHAASKEIEKLQAINPQNTLINYLTAESERKQGNYKIASELYQKSIQQNASLIKARRGLAKSYTQLGKHKKAEETYIKASQLATNNWNVISDLGMFYFRNGNYEKSLKQFKNLIKTSPNNHFGFTLTAASYYAMGDIKNAIEYTKKSIQLKPSDNAYSNLGTMFFSLGQYNQAIEAYEQAIQISNTNFNIWGNLGDAYKLVNNPKSLDCYTQAIKLAKLSLQTNPNDTSVKVDLAYYLSNVGFANEANQYLDNINQANTGMEHFIAAQSYEQLGMIEKSIEHLKTALKKNYSIHEIMNTPLLSRTQEHSKFKQLIRTYRNQEL